MRILITGGYGFLGNHICENLKTKNINEIKNIDDDGDGYFRFHKKDFDIIDFNQCLNLILKFKPDIIIHAAAKVGGIGSNKKYPADYFYENLMMGVNIIHACKNINIKKLILVGTVCSYPKITEVPFKEVNLWNGYPEETNAGYGMSKKAWLTQAISYNQQYGLNFCYILLVNMYGPKDNFNEESSHVIPALIKKFLNAKHKNLSHVEVWGTGNATREFLYVSDAAEGIVRCIDNYNSIEPINIGNGVEITIKELSFMIKDIIEYNGNIIFNDNYPDGQPRRCLDISLSVNKLGKYATTNIYDGLKNTINWYLKTLNKEI